MRGWSDEELKILRSLYSEGATAREIAERLANKTLNQVKSIITRYRSEYGLHYRQLRAKTREEPRSFNSEACKNLIRRPWDGATEPADGE